MRNFALLLVTAFIFFGCSQKEPKFGSEFSVFVKFIEPNGSQNEASFGVNESKTGEIVSKLDVLFKGRMKRTSSYEMARGKANVIAVNENFIDPNDKTSMSDLKKAKRFKFYEFSPSIIESIEYSSNGAVCEEFLLGNEIYVKSATNYFVSKDEFFTSLITAKFIYKKGAKIISKSFTFDIKDEKELAEVREFSTREKALFLDDLKKQGRLLGVLCTI